jgi:hypothetical protein
VSVTFYTVKGGGHGRFSDPKVDELTQKFLEQHLKAPKPGGKFIPTSAYESRTIEGWQVMLTPKLVADRTLCDAVVKTLGSQLFQITRVVPAKPLAKLRRIPIWVEVDDPESHGACYHEDRSWLEANNVNPDKTGAIELCNARAFLTWTDEPMVVLHELAHAYHHQYLDNDSDVRRCYEKAKANPKLKNTLRASGHHERHYALSSEREYFAEMTEALFGTNDYYPFVRAELKEADPGMYAVLRNAWSVN